MLDNDQVEQWKRILCDRFSPEELIEFLGVTTEDVFDKFLDECLELDPEEME